VVTSGRIVTGAGVSAGIDLALILAAGIAGPELAQGIQLAIEYDPHPPFDAGAPSKAPKPILEIAVAALGD
jgi:transcriptional regulator GlxA family with amidase domain